MTDDPATGQTEGSAAAEPAGNAPTQQDFIKARKRRNVMIALSLVAFMVLIFSITAIRLTQNLAARQDAVMEQDTNAPAGEEAESDE